MGVSEKGFVLLSVETVETDEVVAGGATVYSAVAVPAAYEAVELLSLAVYANQVPGAVPDALVVYTLGATSKYGKAIPLVQGEDAQTHELDVLGTRKMRVHRHGVNLYELIHLFLTAHAVNETTFYIRGMIVRYRIPT